MICSNAGGECQTFVAMKPNKVLSVLAAVALSITVLGYALHVAYADNPDRAIPAVGVSSPSAGTIHVVWSAPSETGTPSSYRSFH